MERIDGVPLLNIGDECRMSSGIQHVRSGECSECQAVAQRNTHDFITWEVNSQLRALRSNKTGLEGFVLPPPRIVETRERGDGWPVKRSRSEEYCFVHGDLARQNIMINPHAIRVNCIFDWKQTKYYPPEIELKIWGMIGRAYYDLFRNDELVEYEISLIMGTGTSALGSGNTGRGEAGHSLRGKEAYDHGIST